MYAAKKVVQHAAKKAATAAIKKVGKQAATKTAKSIAKCPKAKATIPKPKPASKPAPKPARKVPKTYDRPSGFRKGVRDKAWDAAKGKDGKVRDPKTKQPMKKTDEWDMGHKPGYEFKKHQQDAMKRGIKRKQFLDEHNNPKHYRPELPSTNRGHSLEAPTGAWKGSKPK
ncbi:MAG: HNH/ENDO VII family nuclease [Novosphingobium sp.]|uniref:HNH/ENDO VII family nuclease n=1 Tax=Novosphingobium sp. TaxID=1874826 RepID=UPI00273236CE|nr:HNH/ENDO VII family nuclease [Novosphingobium sp.]MDP3549726.1 HNH/ENDO VII family nuclease [Novosphingobium sp.]